MDGKDKSFRATKSAHIPPELELSLNVIHSIAKCTRWHHDNLALVSDTKQLTIGEKGRRKGIEKKTAQGQ